MSVGQRIVERLGALKMSKADLADLIKMTRGSVSHYISGFRQPNLEMLARLADVLECSTDYLLGLTDQPSPIVSDQAQPPGKTILMVDDNAVDLHVIDEAFQTCGIAVTLHLVETAIHALSYLAKHPPYEKAQRPNLILMDVNMPLVSGAEAIGLIHREAGWRSIPIIALSVSCEQRRVDECYRSGAALYIVKPTLFDHCVQLARDIGAFLDHGKTIESSEGIHVAKRT